MDIIDLDGQSGPYSVKLNNEFLSKQNLFVYLYLHRICSINTNDYFNWMYNFLKAVLSLEIKLS